MKDDFDALNVKYVEVSRDKVLSYVDKKCKILFVDVDELKGTQAIYSHELSQYKAADVMTYKDFLLMGSQKRDNVVINKIVLREMLVQLKSAGVQCYTMSCRENSNGYLNEFTKKWAVKLEGVPLKQHVIIRKEIAKDFLGDLYTEEYRKALVNMPFAIQSINGVNRLKDVESKYLNVRNGERKTCNQPEQFDRTIYFFGPCIVMGAMVEDKYTIESFLQKMLVDTGYRCRVVNYGCYNYGIVDCKRIMETKFHEGDIVIIYSDDTSFEEIGDLNIVDVADFREIPIEWSTDRVMHCNHKANKLYADAIFEKVKESIIMPMPKRPREIMADRKKYIKKVYIDRYFSNFNPENYKKIGAIVMNCNPFTLGHRYLIEEAYKKVDFLIIFVVEEDKSVFSFEERLEMVCEGTKDLEYIMVVPSGDFILSQTTFPEYFIKVADEDIVQNTDYDITLFADCICSQLNIRYRFVGNEPNDLVTRAYNDAMKRILPVKGIEVIEIMRMNNENECISASLVRKYFENDEIEKAEKLLPDTTRNMFKGCR